MERLITLLRDKNRYLEQFFSVNEHELMNFVDGDFENLASFYEAREQILKQIRGIDNWIAEENRQMSGEALNRDEQAEVEILLKVKDEWVTAILAQDLQVLSCIEKEKSDIIKELRRTTLARRAVGAYRDPMEEFVQIDEKV